MDEIVVTGGSPSRPGGRVIDGSPGPDGWQIPIGRRGFLLGSLGGLAALAAAGCSVRSTAGTGPANGRTVHLTNGAIGFPSPFAANAGLGYTQMSYVYDALLWKDGSGELLPWLAQSFTTSPDHLAYTFVLRDSLKWSDGRPLTADDVVFTFDYYAKQGSLSPPVIVQPPQGIANVKAIDAKTVEITLTNPTATFLSHVAGALPIIPRHIWASISDPGSAQDLKVLVGSGPYRVAQYNQDGGPILFVARDDYFLGPPFVKRIEDPQADDAATALSTGAADIAYLVNARPDALAKFQGSAFGMISDQGSSTNAVYWNLGKEGALSDVRFRRAMIMAVDRQDIITRIAAGRGVPGNPGFLSPSNPFYAPVPQIPFDVPGANAILDSAGYRSPSGGGVRRAPDGTPLSFEMLIDAARADLAEILAADLRRVGIELRPKELTIGPQLFGRKGTGSYDIAVLPFPGPGPGGPNADADTLRVLFTPTHAVQGNLQGATAYDNTAFNALAQQQLATFDETKRKSILAQMQAILAQDLPVCPLYYPQVDAPYRRQLLGDQWYFTPGNFPSWENNKQLMVTGLKTGTTIRST